MVLAAILAMWDVKNQIGDCITVNSPNSFNFDIQGPQGLSGHFKMALTERKKVAMSKQMVASNS